MELIFLLLTILGIIIAIIFGYLQVVVPFIKGEVRFSRRFPFVETAEAAPAAKPHRRKKKKRKRFLIPGLAIGILIILFVLIRFLVFQAKAIEQVPIAVINFTNRTGDEQFDYLCAAIPNLLITNLEQSKHLSIMTWERMHDLLKILGKEDARAVDEDLGFEICEMDDIHAIVIGSFTKAGNMFVTEAKVLDVRSKKLLKSVSSDGEGVASILKTQIDELSKDIARGVSRYERVIETTKFNIEDVTTNSMEAYNYFLRGRDEYEKFYFEEAARYLEKAIEIDSTFASAYLYLAFAFGGLDYGEAYTEALKKAKALSHKATDREKLWIDAWYARDIENDLETRFRILKLLPKKYPKDKRAHRFLGVYYWAVEKDYGAAIKESKIALALDPTYGWSIMDLAYIYTEIGDYDKAIEYFKFYAATFPGDANPFDSMGDLYFQMGRLDDALAKYMEAIYVKPDFWDANLKIAYIHALQEDYEGALKWIGQNITVAPSPGIKAHGYRRKAFYDAHLGNFHQAINDLDTIKHILSPTEFEEDKAVTEWVRGWVYYSVQEYERSRDYLRFCGYQAGWHDPALSVVDSNFCLAIIDLKQEQHNSARTRLAIIDSLLPDIIISRDREEMRMYQHALYAELLLAEDSVDKAIALGQKASGAIVHDPNRTNIFFENFFAVDVAARAYIKKGDINRAILEYERLTDPDPNKRGRCLIRPLWRYELAKLYDQRGLKAKAIQQYQKFLDIWKTADADRPEFIDAKKRLAELKAR